MRDLMGSTLALCLLAGSVAAQSDEFDRRMRLAPLIVLGDSYTEFGLDRQDVVQISRGFIKAPKPPETPREEPWTPYSGPQVWHQTQQAVEGLLNATQIDRFKSYCFQYLVGKEPVSALRYIGVDLEKEAADEITKNSNSLRRQIYAQNLIDRIELAIHALEPLIEQKELRAQLGDLFLWRSNLLDDIWVDDEETLCLQPLMVLVSPHVRDELELSIDQVKKYPELVQKWKRIQRNSEGKGLEKQTALTQQLVEDVATQYLTDAQRERYHQLVKQRFFLAEDLLTTVRLLGLEVPRDKRKLFGEEQMNFYLCLGAVEHLRRYSMRLPLIEDRIDPRKLTKLTAIQFIPCGSYGGKPKIPEAFRDLVATRRKSMNPRRQRR